MNRIVQLFNHVGYRRMAIAVLLSVFLHVLLFGGVSWKLPDLNNNTTIIQAQLVQKAPPKLQELKPVSIKAKPAVRKKVVKPVKVPVIEPKPEPQTENVAVIKPRQSVIDDRNAPTEYIEPPVEALNDPITIPTEDPIPTPYAYVVSEFDAKRGQDASAAGTAKIIYQALPNQHYSLTSQMHAKGLLALFVQQRILSSEGLVTDKGLQPLSFKYQVQNNQEKSTTTVFDWQNKTVTFQTSKGEKKVPLPDGAQDLLTFMYQSMFVPPLNEIKYYVTNGRTMREYDYEFTGEEVISTKIGELNTIHLHRTNDDGDEIIDLWLATDYLHLPVKITQTNKKGSLELYITSLKTEAIPLEVSKVHN